MIEEIDITIKDIETKIDHRDKKVILPYSEKQFNDFLKSLLGRPQKIEKKYSSAFEIELNHIIDVFHLVDQRVGQQNKGNLINFSATISFDDGSSVTLTDIDSLKSYREIKSIVSNSVLLIWTYLIQFEDKNS
ncbi:MAG: hypothetical protein D3910_05840, partial [Candidatus Electrothrix sp. ATG2]|nr:hypothetical protein [Candidatus Electrothrix sp. ATG2]